MTTDGVDSATSHHAFEFRAVLGTVKALRLASPARSAWPSGPDGACAQLADRICVMAGRMMTATMVLLEVDEGVTAAYSDCSSPVSHNTSSASH